MGGRTDGGRGTSCVLQQLRCLATAYRVQGLGYNPTTAPMWHHCQKAAEHAVGRHTHLAQQAQVLRQLLRRPVHHLANAPHVSQPAGLPLGNLHSTAQHSTSCQVTNKTRSSHSMQ